MANDAHVALSCTQAFANGSIVVIAEGRGKTLRLPWSGARLKLIVNDINI